MSKISLALTHTDKQFFLRKYMAQGYDFTDACKEVRHITEYLSDLTYKLKQKGKTPKQIDKKFKEEFEKLCRSLE